MTNLGWVSVFALFTFFSSSFTHTAKAAESGAAGITGSSDTSWTDLKNTLDQRAHTFFLSIEVNDGASALSAGDATTPGSGSLLEIMAIATLQTKSFVIDAGLGWFSSNLSGNATTTAFGLSHYQVSTQALVAELAPAYRLTNHIQMGPLAEFLFGSDVSFSNHFSSNPQTLTDLGGAQAMYGFNFGIVPMKIGARYLTSLNLNQPMHAIQASLQMGLPVY